MSGAGYAEGRGRRVQDGGPGCGRIEGPRAPAVRPYDAVVGRQGRVRDAMGCGWAWLEGDVGREDLDDVRDGGAEHDDEDGREDEEGHGEEDLHRGHLRQALGVLAAAD